MTRDFVVTKQEIAGTMRRCAVQRQLQLGKGHSHIDLSTVTCGILILQPVTVSQL